MIQGQQARVAVLVAVVSIILGFFFYTYKNELCPVEIVTFLTMPICLLVVFLLYYYLSKEIAEIVRDSATIFLILTASILLFTTIITDDYFEDNYGQEQKIWMADVYAMADSLQYAITTILDINTTTTALIRKLDSAYFFCVEPPEEENFEFRQIVWSRLAYKLLARYNDADFVKSTNISAMSSFVLSVSLRVIQLREPKNGEVAGAGLFFDDFSSKEWNVHSLTLTVGGALIYTLRKGEGNITMIDHKSTRSYYVGDRLRSDGSVQIAVAFSDEYKFYCNGELLDSLPRKIKGDQFGLIVRSDVAKACFWDLEVHQPLDTPVSIGKKLYRFIKKFADSQIGD